MTQTQDTQQYEIYNSELMDKLLEGRIRRIKTHEAILARLCQHKPIPVKVKCNITDNIKSVFVNRGQYFSTYNQLAGKFKCSKETARRIIKKLIKQKGNNHSKNQRQLWL